MKRPKLHNNPLSWVETKQVEIKGVRLSDIQFVSPHKLRANPLNIAFFKEESSEYFDKLRSDIKERGIIVPLVAKTDDTLLAGHNRLRVAHELGLENVPVQYVLDVLPAEAERGFIIKDNLYRRHFATAEWIELYKKLYPNFTEQIQQETRGGGRKWKILKNVADSDEENKTEYSVLLAEQHTGRITAEKIAKDTGQKVSAVQKQLTKYRRENLAMPKSKVIQNTKGAIRTNGNADSRAKDGGSTNINSSANTVLVSEVSGYLIDLERKLKKENSKTIQSIVKKIERLLSKISQL
jgi:ParB-like chromosome segregation protein Spo0J